MKKLYSLFAGVCAMASLAIPQTGHAFELEGGNIYGYVINSSSYYYMPSNKFYSFAADNPKTGVEVGSTGYLNPQVSQAGTFVDGKFYAMGGSWGTGYAIIVDNTDGTWAVEGYKAISNLNITTDITEDNGTIYGWCQFSNEAGTWYLSSIDFEAGTVEKIGAGSTTRIVALTSNGKGALYGISTGGDLYSISKTDGSITLIGNTGYTASDAYQSACYDTAKGCMIWGRYYKDGTSFYAPAESDFIDIDLSTGKGTSRASIDNSPQIIGIYAAASYDPNAPGEVTDFSAINDGTDNTINVAFTMPVKNFAGEDFSANLRGLTYTVTLDDNVIIDARSAEKGEKVTLKIETTPGTHTVAVYVSQAVFGTGPEVKATLFVGEDAPGAVTDLKASSEDDVVYLTWKAPASLNGGKYDAEKLSYNISRNGEVVATDVKGTSFTETISTDALIGLTYTVTTVYNGEATSYEATSNAVFVGPAFVVTAANPYAPDFGNCATGEDSGWILVCNPSNYGNPDPTLSIATTDDFSYLKVNVDSYFTDPKLFTTALKLEKDHEYTLNFDFITDNTYGATFSVMLCDTPTKDCQNIKELVAEASYGMYNPNKLNHVGPAKFTVDKTGVYFISIQNYMFNSNWGFANFKLEDTTLPSAIEDINADGVSISASAGKITVKGAKGLPVAVYTVGGVAVHSAVAADDVEDIELAPGFYVVRAGNKTLKVNI